MRAKALPKNKTTIVGALEEPRQGYPLQVSTGTKTGYNLDAYFAPSLTHNCRWKSGRRL